MHRVLIKSLLAGWLLVGPVAVSRAELSPDEVMTLTRKVRPSVMCMLMLDESGKIVGSGTGFIVSRDGKLATNRHIASAGASLAAKAPNGKVYRVLGVLAEDADQDAVILQLEEDNLPPVSLGASENANVGASVVMVGNPLGMESTVQQGTVGGFRKILGSRRWIEVKAAIAAGDHDANTKLIHSQGLQVSTSVAHGSSGSPVFTANGDVIGMITGLDQDRPEQDTALAIPAETITDLIAKSARAEPKPFAQMTRRSGNDFSSDAEYVATVKAINTRDFTEAERHAQIVVTRYPDSATALVLLGQLQLQRRNGREAGATFERAIQLKRDLAPAWSGLANAYLLQDLKDRARDAYRELQKLDPILAKQLADAAPELAR